jgi:probable O-glycosylation ligase (exosortase A-associated)
MPIRDIAVTLGILGSLPICFLRPWIGILVWAILSFMNPHRLAWDFASDLPFAQLVALATLAGFILTRDRKRFLWTRENVLLIALGIWFTITSLFSVYPESAWLKWNEVSKALLMALLCVPLFQDRAKLRILLLTIAASIGFYGFKGGLFVLVTGGRWMVHGPQDTAIASNNDIALALNMCLPLLIYLAREEPRRWAQIMLRAAFVLSVVAVPFTYSRGGMLGLAVVLTVLFFRPKARVFLLATAVAGLFALFSLAPAGWLNRVETLNDVESDESANLRLMSWRVARMIAADHPMVGGGLRVLHHRETYDKYLPEYPRAFGHDAHSIYFNLLAENGVVGLGLFLLLVFFSFGTLRRLRRLGRERPDLAWFTNYANMLQASLIAYLATGAFLSVAYFDLAYQLFVIVGILNGMAASQLASPAPVSKGALAPPGLPPARLHLPLPARVN